MRNVLVKRALDSTVYVIDEVLVLLSTPERHHLLLVSTWTLCH